MGRSGYTDDCENINLWRGVVARAIRGKRGQKLLRELLAAIDEMPSKRLIANEIVDDAGEVCLLGAVGRKRQLPDLEKIDPEDHDRLAGIFDAAPALIQEIEWVNDEGAWSRETPEQRYERVHKWLTENIALEPA